LSYNPEQRHYKTPQLKVKGLEQPSVLFISDPFA